MNNLFQRTAAAAVFTLFAGGAAFAAEAMCACCEKMKDKPAMACCAKPAPQPAGAPADKPAPPAHQH